MTLTVFAATGGLQRSRVGIGQVGGYDAYFSGLVLRIAYRCRDVVTCCHCLLEELLANSPIIAV